MGCRSSRIPARKHTELLTVMTNLGDRSNCSFGRCNMAQGIYFRSGNRHSHPGLISLGPSPAHFHSPSIPLSLPLPSFPSSFLFPSNPYPHPDPLPLPPSVPPILPPILPPLFLLSSDPETALISQVIRSACGIAVVRGAHKFKTSNSSSFHLLSHAASKQQEARQGADNGSVR